MKKFLIIGFMFFSVVSQTSATPLSADSSAEISSAWSGGLEMATTNNYLWRGITVNEGVILQPNAWLSYNNLTVDIWSSFTLNKPDDDIKRPEVDAIISYEMNLMNFTIEPSFNYYHYIDQADATDTGEFGCNVAYPIGIVTLNAGVFVDVMEYSGATYMEESAEIEKEINDHVSLFTALRIGSGFKKFNESYFELSKSTISLLSLDGRMTYSMDNGLYLQPYFQLNKTLSNDLEVYLKKSTSAVGLLIGKEF
jgi:hypothetical protein